MSGHIHNEKWDDGRCEKNSSFSNESYNLPMLKRYNTRTASKIWDNKVSVINIYNEIYYFNSWYNYIFKLIPWLIIFLEHYLLKVIGHSNKLRAWNYQNCN